MTTTFVQNQALFKDLTALLTGELLLPDDAAYEQVRHLWNGNGKLRIMTTPGGLDEYFETISPLTLPEDMDRFIEISKHYGIEFMAPEPPKLPIQRQRSTHFDLRGA